MIPPHTVFLLQFAKYRPDCAAKYVAPASTVAGSAPKKILPERRVPSLHRLFNRHAARPLRG